MIPERVMTHEGFLFIGPFLDVLVVSWRKVWGWDGGLSSKALVQGGQSFGSFARKLAIMVSKIEAILLSWSQRGVV